MVSGTRVHGFASKKDRKQQKGILVPGIGYNTVAIFLVLFAIHVVVCLHATRNVNSKKRVGFSRYTGYLAPAVKPNGSFSLTAWPRHKIIKGIIAPSIMNV